MESQSAENVQNVSGTGVAEFNFLTEAYDSGLCWTTLNDIQTSSWSHHFLFLIALSRCKFHKIVFFIFPTATYMPFWQSPILTQKSQGMLVVRTFCSFNAKTIKYSGPHFLFHDFDSNNSFFPMFGILSIPWPAKKEFGSHTVRARKT